jgi:hypothetical protein
MVGRPRCFGLALPSSDTGAFVVSVQKIGAQLLKWTFDRVVTSSGAAEPNLKDNNLSSAAAPITTVQNGPNAVTAGYSAGVTIGDTWQMSLPITQIATSPGFGPTQSGLVT